MTVQPWPRSCLVAAAADANSGHASAAPCTGLPPVSYPTIASSDDDVDRCHPGSESDGTDSPAGEISSPPLPSAPYSPWHVQLAGPNSIMMLSSSLKTAKLATSPTGTLTSTEVGSGSVVGAGVTANEVGQGTTGSVARARVDACEAVVVEVDVDVEVTEDNVEPAVELDLDFVTGWDDVADVDLGMDVPPQPAITTRPVNPSPTNHTVIASPHPTPPAPRSPATD